MCDDSNSMSFMVNRAMSLEESIARSKQEFQTMLKTILKSLGSGSTLHVPGKGLYTIMCRDGLYYWRTKPVGIYGIEGTGAIQARKVPVRPKK